MQCPNCSLYHPPRYQNCVSCGAKLVAQEEAPQPPAKGGVAPAAAAESSRGERKQRGLPMGVGIAIAGFILCASAGGTIFFLTKPPENERLYQEGQKQLQLGQYAFAVKSLNEAVKVRPNDAKALLALARAYVGVDQVDKAWECITQAQQLGAGVVAEPQLASDLANYYRQRNQYDKAVELLRPLAAAGIQGKKAELADLDAAWGDECIRSGDFKTAMRCWEEVKEMHDGSRFAEAESRLSTIYQKIADSMLAKGDEQEALKYYTKLNVSAPSAGSYEKTADLYERQGKLELAVDQMEKAMKLSHDNSVLAHKMSGMMIKLGKEMMDRGDADAGYGYLQKAQSFDPRAKVPTTTVRSVRLEVDGPNGNVHIWGEVWNPTPEPLNAVTLRAELVDKKTSRVIWSKDHRVIDEFVPPLPSRDARAFDLNATAPFDPASSEMRLYLNGTLYKTYALAKGASAAKVPVATSGDTPLLLRPRLVPPVSTTNDATPHPDGPQLAPSTVGGDTTAPQLAPSLAPVPSGGSAEEKTLKDLE